MRLRPAGLAAAVLAVVVVAAPCARAAACRPGERAWGGFTSGRAAEAVVATAWRTRSPPRLAVVLRDDAALPDDEADAEARSVWVSRAGVDGLCLRRLLAGRGDRRPERNLLGLDSPAFSPDGRTLYVLAAAWGTDGAVHALDVRTGAERFVSRGSDLQVVAEGRYRGDLVLAQHTALPGGRIGYEFPSFVVRPSDGRAMVRIPGTHGEGDDPVVARWLAAHGAGPR